MAESLRDIQTRLGAVFEENAVEEKASVPLSFGNEPTAIQAARTGVAICDHTHWGRIQVARSDRLNFLHNQSTNDFNRLKPGEGCDTVFVTSTARTIDLATAYILEDTILVLVSPNRRAHLLKWLDRYIFFGDQVTLTDLTEQTSTFSLIGSESSALLQQLGLDDLSSQPYASHRLMTLGGHVVRIAVGSGLALEGYTLTMATSAMATVWRLLTEAGAVPLGDRAWEHLRIEQGRPAPDRELTEDYNPLEAGLWQMLSFDKGCYIGQETIARLDTYKGVKQQLWGIRLKSIAAPGSIITREEEKIGTLTSLTETEQGAVGLAYIRTKAGGAGLHVQVGDTEGDIVEVPFVKHERVSL
ncbi:YgfZ/GcvT domain-containing protein [Stenomitos frigidus]|uniref:Folate-binding protein YgfZ n=1 Tax=Stenomitos frigidus ULC18 TaxID=2107698 RepID=A0A2T1DTZ2_9CYAN|nr:folate-binding protein YgfZ [Stenomitos frigidus]PSB23973.1 folate-binding protein YgfZ [Stenomitos frigidus ULC18]